VDESLVTEDPAEDEALASMADIGSPGIALGKKKFKEISKNIVTR